MAQVTAINGEGAVIAASTASAVVSNSGTKTEGTSYLAEPGSTVEYHVSLSGTEAAIYVEEGRGRRVGPEGRGEYEDNDPIEGMAVFRPDEPQRAGQRQTTIVRRSTI